MGMAYHVELHAHGTPLWLYQGCQIGHFAAKFLKFAVFQVGWSYDFWVGRLAFFGRFAENIFCWPFLKMCLYFKAKLCKLSTTTLYLKVSSPVCAFRLV